MKKFLNLILAAAMLLGPAGASAKSNTGRQVRLLYWNIQNGMWADQGNNYDTFVEFVKNLDPEICVWCEAKTHYKTDSDESYKLTDELYLPAHWPELAARYGHNYVYVGGERDFFPQVITSCYPIEGIAKIVGDPDDVVVSHGAGWAQITIDGKVINIVTMHTWPQKYNFGIDKSDKAAIEASTTLREGDDYRAKEVEYVCKHTIGSVEGSDKQLWMMMGDMNSKSRADNAVYRHNPDSKLFQAQDYIHNFTPYVDVIGKWYGSDFQSSHYNGLRIDYIYCTKPLFKMVKDAQVLREGWSKNYKIKGSKKGFCYPSDHLPIMVDFEIK